MNSHDAVKLIQYILIGIPTLAVGIASVYAWYSCSAVSGNTGDYHTNHVNRKGY